MIDWVRVRELCDEVGRDDFQEIVELFLEEVSEVVERLRTAPQMDRLAEDLHFLKGSALNLGFASLSELCQAGETTAGRGEAERVDVGAIVTIYDLSKTEFLNESGAQLAA